MPNFCLFVLWWAHVRCSSWVRGWSEGLHWAELTIYTAAGPSLYLTKVRGWRKKTRFLWAQPDGKKEQHAMIGQAGWARRKRPQMRTHQEAGVKKGAAHFTSSWLALERPALPCQLSSSEPKTLWCRKSQVRSTFPSCSEPLIWGTPGQRGAEALACQISGSVLISAPAALSSWAEHL